VTLDRSRRQESASRAMRWIVSMVSWGNTYFSLQRPDYSERQRDTQGESIEALPLPEVIWVAGAGLGGIPRLTARIW